ncbi:MAG: ATP-dependent DNA helicase [Eubacteriales bacterium]|nr:ATP-dependent DNA helicase [Eubacteriales bacterium]
MRYQREKKSAAEMNRLVISVRELLESVMRTGGLLSPIWAAPQWEAGRIAEDLVHARLMEIAAERDCPFLKRADSSLLAASSKDLFLTFEHGLELELSRPALDSLIVLRGRADVIARFQPDELRIYEIKAQPAGLDQLPKDGYPHHWAQVKLYGYSLMQLYDWPENTQLKLALYYQDPNFPDAYRIIEESCSKAELTNYCEQLLGQFERHFKPLNPFSPAGLEKLKGLKFPYSNFRKGQREMTETVLRIILENSIGLLQAPTGLGKTLATLYPALRALLFGYCDSVFYATAMTSTRSVVETELENLRKSCSNPDGEVFLRSLRLDTKWNFCLDRRYFCDQRRCPYAKNYYDNLNPALNELAAIPALSIDNIKPIAEKYRLCPHQLALDIALYCHVVIGDYNHLFSPNARLKTYLNPDERKVTLLVDEAHNLPARAREIFTARLASRDILKAQALIGEIKFKEFKRQEELSAELSKLQAVFESLANYADSDSATEIPEEFYRHNPLKDGTDSSVWAATRGFIALRLRPDKLEPISESVLKLLKELIDLESAFNSTHPIVDLFFQVLNLREILSEEYADNYLTTFAKAEAGGYELSLLCLDAREQLSRYYNRIHPTVFFSATLSPIYYYRELLSKSKDDCYAEAYPNPFIDDNLKLLVLSEFSLRSADRAQSFRPIMEFILQLATERIMNCLIYVPSWAYLEAVKEYFAEENLGDKIRLSFQSRQMSYQDKAAFVAQFSDYGKTSLLAFAVLASNFNEGIDLKGEKLSAVIVLSTAHPALSPERQLLAEYVDKKYSGNGENYTYLCPGFNRVQQAVGRLIRDPNDVGLAVLIDDRWLEAKYQQLFPEEWQPHFCQNRNEALVKARRFWARIDRGRGIK